MLSLASVKVMSRPRQVRRPKSAERHIEEQLYDRRCLIPLTWCIPIQSGWKGEKESCVLFEHAADWVKVHSTHGSTDISLLMLSRDS